MVKKIFWILKRGILATILIYSFDMFAFSLNMSIPINIITVLLVSVFDIPALICLVLFSFVL